MLASGLGLQVQPDVPADKTFYAVSYVETRSNAVKDATAALHRYRDANGKLDGFVRIEFFEQIGRPGHFVVFETWRDQQAFDARDAAIQKQLIGALQPIRVSDYDQRPYKTLTVAPGGDQGGPAGGLRDRARGLRAQSAGAPDGAATQNSRGGQP